MGPNHRTHFIEEHFVGAELISQSLLKVLNQPGAPIRSLQV